MSRISNRRANELHTLAQRLNAVTVRAYLFHSKTTDVRDELVVCRQELTRIIQDMMSDYYREEAMGANARENTDEEHVGPELLPPGAGGGLHDEG